MLSIFSWLREVFFIAKILFSYFVYFIDIYYFDFLSSGENEKLYENSELPEVILTINF